MLNRSCVLSLALVSLVPGLRSTLTAQRPANANAFYQQLRTLLPGGEVIAIKNLEFKRDAATLTFGEGNIAFYGQVNGKITGAVFEGEGHFHLAPPNAQERHCLRIATGNEEFDEDFDRVVLRFTDATAAELHKASSGAGQTGGEYTQAAQELHNFMRTKLRSNMDLRILEDVLSPKAGHYFVAAIHGRKNPHLIFTIDPHGDGDLAPEEVSLLIYNDWGPSWPAAFHWATDGDHGGALIENAIRPRELAVKISTSPSRGADS